MPEDTGSARHTETRKLAAIMFTDIVDFSRQMGADEARMLRLLDIHNHIIQHAVTEYHGTVIKTVGDAFLVDFPSVVHAVQCAQRIQDQFRSHNREKETPEQIHVRIGIHLGDIVQRAGDVFGDGVNIASRLQALAEPDIICLSDVVYRDVAQKIPLGTVVSLGRPQLKGIRPHVLEGSVQKASDQVRIVAQLIDATTGGHLWAERYDRPFKDIFALQDELVQRIVTTLKLQLTLREKGYLVRERTTDNLEAYDSYLCGVEWYWRFTKEANIQARRLFTRAVELDPTYAEAYARLGWTYSAEWVFQWSRDPQTLERAFELAQKAIALDDTLPRAHMLLGFVYLFKGQHAEAIAEGTKAMTLDPNDADSYAIVGQILNYAERPEEAVEVVEKGMRLNPHLPAYYLSVLGHAYRLLGRPEEAIAILKRAIAHNPNFLGAHTVLAYCYGDLGREGEARAEGAEILRISPHFSLEDWKKRFPHKDPAVVERFLAALRGAGLK